MATDQHHAIGPFVRRFLLEEVLADRNLSHNTLCSYRDAIVLLFRFMVESHGIAPTRLDVEHVTAEVVRAFLAYLENERGNSISTRNQRLCALHSLFRYVSCRVPELVEQARQIQAIPPRRTVTTPMLYLDKHEMEGLLACPDNGRQGRRDHALLLFLYNSGARASEAATTTVGDLGLHASSASVRLLGKGRKIRMCPLWPHTADVLRELLGSRLEGPKGAPVFLNVRGQPVTRYGIHDLVVRTAVKAAASIPSLRAKQVSPHTIRHTTAVHLLRAGVDINTIRAWLGHVSLETTNRYAQIDLAMKAEALETCAVRGSDSGSDSSIPQWTQDCELLAFLTSL